MKKKLRTGYTTGASAAAAAKAAMLELLGSGSGVRSFKKIKNVEIPFPDGSRVTFKIHNSELITHNSRPIVWASVIKDAGGDPDVTNGAEIVAEVKLQKTEEGNLRRWEDKQKMEDKTAGNNYFSTSHPLNFPSSSLLIRGGEGVGIITKPGLSVPVGEAAINPVPRRMIKEAVMEAIMQSTEHRIQSTDKKSLGSGFWVLDSGLEIIISVPDGKALAKKTLNSRLGIVGGISILGTTGVVRPISSEAWTATISASMDVAKAMGSREIVLSAGRSSEKAHMKKYNLTEESYVMMGDHLEFSLLEAKGHGFKQIHLAAQWAKMLKIAMATPQTHVRHGAIDIKKAVEFLNSLGINLPQRKEFNTAREILDFIDMPQKTPGPALTRLCSAAGRYAGGIAKGIPVAAYLVSYEGEVIADSG